jgi:hypothetical protein
VHVRLGLIDIETEIGEVMEREVEVEEGFSETEGFFKRLVVFFVEDRLTETIHER